MTTTLEEVALSALQLPGRQRLALAGFLLETTEGAADTDTEEVWDREIQDRVRAVDSGNVAGVSWKDVMEEADRRLAP